MWFYWLLVSESHCPALLSHHKDIAGKKQLRTKNQTAPSLPPSFAAVLHSVDLFIWQVCVAAAHWQNMRVYLDTVPYSIPTCRQTRSSIGEQRE